MEGLFGNLQVREVCHGRWDVCSVQPVSMPRFSSGSTRSRQERAEELIFDYCHQRVYVSEADTDGSEPVPATGQGTCKPHLFSGHERTGLAVSGVSFFIALIFLARRRYGH